MEKNKRENNKFQKYKQNVTKSRAFLPEVCYNYEWTEMSLTKEDPDDHKNAEQDAPGYNDDRQ